MNELSDKDRPKKLEELFRSGMEEAEVSPSDQLWSRIEQGLDLKEAGYYKKQVGWYQMVAAACLVLALFAGGYMYYDLNQEKVNIAQSTSLLKSKISGKSEPNENNLQIASAEKNKPVIAKEKSFGNKTESSTLVAANNNHSVNAKALNLKVKTEKLASSNNLNNKFVDREGINNEKPSFITTTTAESKIAADISLAAGEADTKSETALSPISDNVLAPKMNGGSQSLLNEMAMVKVDKSFGTNFNNTDSINLTKELTNTNQVLNPNALAMYNTPLEAEKKTVHNRWSFGGKYSPHYFNQNISLASGTPSPALALAQQANRANPLAYAGTSSFTEALNEFDNNTASNYSYNVGVATGYKLSENVTLESGFDYTENSAITNTSYIFNNSVSAARYNPAAVPLNTFADASSNSNIVTALPTTALVAALAGEKDINNVYVSKTSNFNTRYRYRMVGIPVKVNYNTIKNPKSFYYASIGLITNLLVQANILSESSQVPDLQFGTKGETPFQHWQFAAEASAGKGFKLSEGFNVRAGLEATQYLTSLAANPDNLQGKQGRAYSVGVSLSSSYTLGKKQ